MEAGGIAGPGGPLGCGGPGGGGPGGSIIMEPGGSTGVADGGLSSNLMCCWCRFTRRR